MKGELYIRTSATASPTGSTDQYVREGWVDAYETWGVSFTDSSLSALLTPAPLKAPIENKSRLQHGKSLVQTSTYIKKDEREVTIEMHIKANSRAGFISRYDSFCNDVLSKQFIEIRSGYTPSKVFHMTYESCSQFSEFIQQIAKFSLRLNEPNPDNRTE